MLLVNRWLGARDRNRAESGDVTRARIDDGTALRAELWTRLRELEAELSKARTEGEQLRAEQVMCTAELKLVREDLQVARGEIRGLLAQISALRQGT